MAIQGGCIEWFAECFKPIRIEKTEPLQRQTQTPVIDGRCPSTFQMHPWLKFYKVLLMIFLIDTAKMKQEHILKPKPTVETPQLCIPKDKYIHMCLYVCLFCKEPEVLKTQLLCKK